MKTCTENDILATIMIQNDVSYETAVVLLLIYRDLVLHAQKTDAILEKIMRAAFEEVRELTWKIQKAPTLARGLFCYFILINISSLSITFPFFRASTLIFVCFQISVILKKSSLKILLSIYQIIFSYSIFELKISFIFWLSRGIDGLIS